jgi:MFS family permease
MEQNGHVPDEEQRQPATETTETTPLINGRTPASQPDDEETVIEDTIPPARLYTILCTIYVGVFLAALDSSIIATLSAPIASEFHSLSLLSWLATAYLIANAACQPVSGRLTDIFGRGPGLVFSNVFFAAGTLLCGLAWDEGSVVAGRVIAGVGGGGLTAISTFLASDLIPLRQRGVWQGVGNVAFGAGAMVGGVFGGVINDTSSRGWRLAFLVQVPVVVVSGVLVFFLVDIPPKISNKSYISRIDFTGMFSLVAFLVLLLLGLNAGGNLVPWGHPLVLATIPLSVATLLCFLVWETRAKQPIIPVRLFVNRTVLTGCLTNLFGTMAMMIAVFYVPLYMQAVLGASTSEAGLRLLVSPLGGSLASVGSGLVMKRTGRYMALGWISLLMVVAAFVVAAVTFAASPPVWAPFVTFVLLGAGYTAMLTITMVACIAAVDHGSQAVVTSATYAFRSVGATVGITIASAVYQNILRARLWDRFGDLPGAAEEIARIRDDLNELKHLPEGWYPGVIASFVEAFRGVWITCLGLSVLGFVCVALMKQHVLHNTLSRSE